MDAKMASWKSTGTYIDEVPPPGANIVSGMWIFKVKRPPGFPPVFKARYVASGFSQRQGVDFFQTFSPTPKMTTLWVLLHVAAQRDYELHSLDFSTAFLQGSLHEEIWLRHPPGFTGSFPAGTQWSLRRPVYGLRLAPREWHDTPRTTLATIGFAPSTADPSLFLSTGTTLPPFYVLVYVDDLVFATADTEALAHMKSELQKRHTCTDLGPLALRLHVLIATVHSSAYRSLTLSSTYGRVLCRAWGSCLEDGLKLSSLVTQTPPSSSCEAEIYDGAMAAQELCWLTYLLTDLGEAPRSPPVLYVDNKAMLALCQEHRLEHRTKHIALRYFLARELQQRGQLRLAYVASQANTADVFTKALQPCDHQPCFAFLDWSCDLLFSPTLPKGLCPTSRAALARPSLPVAPPCRPPRRPLQHARRPLQPAHRPAAVRPALPVRRSAGRRAALGNPRVALLQPAMLPFAARAPPLAACVPPIAPARRPAAARPAAQPCWPAPCCPHSPAARHPAACAARLLPALLRAALLAGALLPACRHAGSRTAARTALPAPPCYCPPYLPTPCCPRAALLPAHRPGRPIQFDTWLDDLRLYLLSDSRDSVLLFDHTSGASLAPPATADNATRSQWLTRDAVARLAVRNNLPLAERAHFGQHKTAKALYDVVVAR
ncbi:unnamed protein product [Closterium sp. NIES-53]